MQAPDTVSVQVRDDRAAAPVTLEVSASLAAVLARAAAVGSARERFALSFGSLWIGLWAAPDDTGAWLRDRYASIGPGMDGWLSGLGLRWADVEAWAAGAAGGEPPAPLGAPLSRTASAGLAIDEAVRRARAQQAAPTPAHLLQAMLGLPRYHEDDFRRMGIDREAWARSFAGHGAQPVESAAGKAPDAPAADLAADLAEGAGPGTSAAGASAWTLQLDADGVEPHLVLALRRAAQRAGTAEIDGAAVVGAAADLAPTVRSAAFLRLAELLGAGASVSGDGGAADLAPAELAARLSPALRDALARVQAPATPGAAPGPLWGRDLVTAALLAPGPALEAAFAAAGRDLASVRERWYAFLTSDTAHRSAAQWAAWWRHAGVALPGPRRAGYALETDRGEDQLGVQAEARAFARLILDKDVHPPLSIGLLGDWGSGKSFFIEQIRQSVAALREEGRPELHRHVVEIEFNAWHASDANLWASLITEIFDRIWDSVRPGAGSGEQAREQLRKRIEEAHGALHQAQGQLEAGEKALEQAEQALQEKHETLALNAYLRQEALQRLQALVRATGWHRSIDTIKDAEAAARELAASGSRLRTVANVLLNKPLQHIAMPTAGVLALAAAVWLLVDASALQGWEEALSKALAGVAGAVGALVAPLRAARGRLDALARELGQVSQQYDAALAQARTSGDSERVARAQHVDKARRELESAQASVESAKARLAELLTQRAAQEPMQRLGAFIQDRVQSTQYRAQQGIISLVHKDFRELSRVMKDLREAADRDAVTSPDAPGAASPDAIRPIDRIVLYVDDLDRCRPAHVVNMLEAVHLLLALDLFVVIVAVDSRWLTRSLDVYYSDLLGAQDDGRDGLRASTAQNYLEKIFQITYALAPMNPRHFQGYVDFLTQDGQGGATGAGALAGAAQGATVAASLPQPLPDGLAQAGAQDAAAPAAGTPGAATAERAPQQDTGVQRPRRGAEALPTRSASVQFTAQERAFIGTLVPLLPTPRIAKRLVNVYRVLKAGKSVEEADRFERASRAQPCLLMLAILFGRPLIATELLRGLAERTAPFDRPERRLVEALHARGGRAAAAGGIGGGADAGPGADWHALAETLQAMGVDAAVGACAAEVLEVARYSLVTGHDWHTWRLHGATGAASAP